MEELIKAMSDEDLAGLKIKYANQPSLATLIDGILETRTKEAEIAKTIALRDKVAIKATNAILGEPSIWQLDWRKLPENQSMSVTTVEVDDTSQPQVEAVLNGVSELRYPKKLTRKVVIGTAITLVGKSPGQTTKTNGSKRAITVYKRNGTQLELIGHFASGQACCDHLKIPTGSDDAKRVLVREGYIHEPYEGTDYTTA